MNLLYIHTLPHLSPKMAELESVYLVRELKQKVKPPLSLTVAQEHFSEFLVSPTDKETIEQGLAAIEPAVQIAQQILGEQNSLHELINVQRTLQILQEMPQPLFGNLRFLEEISLWQEQGINEFVVVLNTIPRCRTQDEKKACDARLSALFEKILRNNILVFRSHDIINEAQLAHINGLQEGMTKGYLFHISLEDELKKRSFEVLKQGLPAPEIERNEQLQIYVTSIKRAVERAYQANFRMVQWATLWYAYVKWAMSG